jgi:hypothetical protein
MNLGHLGILGHLIGLGGLGVVRVTAQGLLGAGKKEGREGKYRPEGLVI